MWLIVGLGNPGREYENTRHNAGFLVLDEILKKSNAQAVFARHFSLEKKFLAETVEISVDGTKALLVKPQTFMNRSGDSVLVLSQFYKVPPEQIVVVHDELDIPLGELRLKQGGGSGGHNGIKSIDSVLPRPNYFRVRVGIGKPPIIGSDGGEHVVRHVLAAFGSEEKETLATGMADAADGIQRIVTHDLAHSQKYLSGLKSKRIRLAKELAKAADKG